MSVKTIPYSETGYFSKLVCDYLAEKPELQSFYHRFPKLENFEKQLEEKQEALRLASAPLSNHSSVTKTECHPELV